MAYLGSASDRIPSVRSGVARRQIGHLHFKRRLRDRSCCPFVQHVLVERVPAGPGTTFPIADLVIDKLSTPDPIDPKTKDEKKTSRWKSFARGGLACCPDVDRLLVGTRRRAPGVHSRFSDATRLGTLRRQPSHRKQSEKDDTRDQRPIPYAAFIRETMPLTFKSRNGRTVPARPMRKWVVTFHSRFRQSPRPRPRLFSFPGLRRKSTSQTLTFADNRRLERRGLKGDDEDTPRRKNQSEQTATATNQTVFLRRILI